MSSHTVCPQCAADITPSSQVCPHCGNHLSAAEAALIRRPAGKLQAIGTLILASGLITTIAGTWWGAALLFPGAVLIFLGWLL